MPSCVVKWCRSHTSIKCPGISFHSFPVDEVRKSKWVAAVRLPNREDDWMPTKTSKVCSIHFKEDEFNISPKGNHMLIKTAVPVCTMVRTPEGATSTQLIKINENLAHIPNIAGNAIIVANKEVLQLKENDDSPVKSIPPQRTLHESLNLPTSYAEENKAQKRKLEQPSSSGYNEEEERATKITKDNDAHKYNLEDKRLLCDTPLNIPSSEVESVLNTPKTHMLKQKLKQKTSLAQRRLSKIKTLQRKNKRLRIKNISLKDVISQLKKNGFGDSNQNTALGEFSDDIVLALKKKQSKKGRSIIKFTPTMTKFALTLNYYSPAGYKFVRRQLLSSLPHPSTLSKWYQTIDGKPGFTEEAFNALKLKYSLSDKRLACLIVDEMAIRQQKIFNGKSVDGLVTFGPSDEIATQLYVLILVALNDSFKLPLGYYFVNGLAAEQRSNIIKMCLEKCHDVGAEVVSLTFDGCASNMATAKTLGCNFENPSNLKSYFDHPTTGAPVVVILDPCHMVKLVRNTLEAKKTLVDLNGQKVQWTHLQNLKNVQDKIGLHFGNKLTDRHLEFRNNIMNVKLATQTLSNSVAVALKLCSQELKMPDFQDTNATIHFIETFNNLFDILNTKSLSGQAFKHPFSLEQKQKLYQYLDQAKLYIEGLSVDVQTKKTRKVEGQKVTECTTTQKQLITTQSKTGFLGLLICISSFKLLFEQLVENRKVLKFILPYKFSQDHIELFFGVIRNHGRCNNNPNARQFMGIYKKTLLNLELRSKFTGNCIPLEDIPILNCSSAINKTTPGFRHKLQETENTSKLTVNTEMENCTVLSHTLDVDRLLPKTVEQIIGYIGGFVAKKLQSKLECPECLDLLQANEKLYFHKLISLKDFGGLLYPSVILFKICSGSETLLRQILKINGNKKSLTRASNLSVLAHQCFCKVIERRDIVSTLRQSHDNNSCHDVLLTKTIIEEFLKVRLHYIAKNESLLNSSRNKLNKLIIFRGTYIIVLFRVLFDISTNLLEITITAFEIFSTNDPPRLCTGAMLINKPSS